MTWILAIFKIFSARYMHKWNSCLEGNENFIANEWSKQLSGLTGRDIKRGLANWNNDWPPSSNEFKKACMLIKRAAPYHRDYISIKCIESDSDRHNRRVSGAAKIKQIKALIK